MHFCLVLCVLSTEFVVQVGNSNEIKEESRRERIIFFAEQVEVIVVVDVYV